ncbi:hypothetical protein, conserved [Entamoeba dispar SAW760]|uniref:DH domain-containing protein n=1 Tax=Entamoeba dispar (strain ATCC PRA-260 / SAW760) TaxID=370354 RepID=B0E8F4_ENTDS|nr:uncharacterized protein EDI_033040 [Entamoeba dispar SAW760]EDR29197.1 hypothetical protein, conserved [Entamoeba dispar SAW760]|eukprot:EDR29197.1 hypothetical protein, conserved [Entamoeba dispar SAW760]
MKKMKAGREILEKHPSVLKGRNQLDEFTGTNGKSLNELEEMFMKYNELISQTIQNQTKQEKALVEALKRLDVINTQILEQQTLAIDYKEEKERINKLVEDSSSLINVNSDIISKSQEIQNTLKKAINERSKIEHIGSCIEEINKENNNLSPEEVEQKMKEMKEKYKITNPITQTPSTLEIKEQMTKLILPTKSFVLESYDFPQQEIISRHDTEELKEESTPTPSRHISNYLNSSLIGGSYIKQSDRIAIEQLIKQQNNKNSRNGTKTLSRNITKSIAVQPINKTKTKELINEEEKIKNERKSSLILLKMVSNKLVRTKGDIKIKEMFIERFRIIKEFTEYMIQYINWYNWLERDVYRYSLYFNLLKEKTAKELFSIYFQTLESDREMTKLINNLYGIIENTKIGNECDRFDELINGLNNYLNELPKFIDCANYKENTLNYLKEVFINNNEFKLLIDKKNDSNCIEELVDIPEFHIKKLINFIQNLIQLTPIALQTDTLKECQFKISSIEIISQKSKTKLNDFNYLKEFGHNLVGFEELTGEEFIKDGRRIIQKYSIKIINKKKLEKKLLVLCNDIILICSKPNRNGCMFTYATSPLIKCNLILSHSLNEECDAVKKVTKTIQQEDLINSLLKKAKIKKSHDVRKYCSFLEFVGKIAGSPIIQLQQILFWGIPESNSAIIKIALINAIASKKTSLIYDEND